MTSSRCGDISKESLTPTLVGGEVESVEVLLEKGPSLDVIPDLPEERQFPVVASIKDKVFLCGGSDGNQSKSTCFFYSFTQRQWIEMDEPMPNGNLSRSAGVAAYGDFYILGGQTQDGEPTQAVSKKILGFLYVTYKRSRLGLEMVQKKSNFRDREKSSKTQLLCN